MAPPPAVSSNPKEEDGKEPCREEKKRKKKDKKLRRERVEDEAEDSDRSVKSRKKKRSKREKRDSSEGGNHEGKPMTDEAIDSFIKHLLL